MSNFQLAPGLRNFLLTADDKSRTDYLAELPDATLADILASLAPEQIWNILALIFPQRRAMVFGHLGIDLQVRLTGIIGHDQLAGLITLMSADERVDLFKQLSEDKQETIWPLLARVNREDIRKLSSYPEGTAGAIMTSDYVFFTPDLPVADALQKLRREWPGKETIYYTYVVNKKRQLLGYLSLRELIVAHPAAIVGDIMNTDIVFIRANDSREETANLIAKHDLIALPVVNGGGAFVGIVTHDDALDVMTEEATEDILRMAGTDVDEHKGGSFSRSIFLRSPWLTVNLVTALCSSFVVSRFSDTISQYVMLAAMMPVIAGLGGNAGTQTLAVTVRGIALGEISPARGWRVILREMGICFSNGIMIGSLVGVITYYWLDKAWLGLIMLMAMTTNFLIAGIFGSAIPLALKALKLDPALGSSVFITAATDVGGFAVFLSLATLMLHHL